MKTYQPRTLINGYKLGKEYGGKKIVAVPHRFFDSTGKVLVRHDNSKMIVEANKALKKSEPFEDKYGRGTYWLYYFTWQGKPGPVALTLPL